MIVGIGLDTIGVARVAERLRNEEGLKEALFTSAEIGYCEPRQNRDECYAARFAAKEALLKAIGTDGRAGVRFTDIEIVRDAAGKPNLALHGKAKTWIEENGITNIQVSLSHVRELACAMVALERGEGKQRMSNVATYEERRKSFDWSISEKELAYTPGDVINIGWYCSDRICQMGKADKIALLWEGFAGQERTYTYNDVRLAANAIGAFLKSLGIQPADRVCLFLDRIPELYIGFLGILKIGAIAQPLFSAFGDESLFVRLNDATTSCVITQRKHVGKVRRILEQMP